MNEYPSDSDLLRRIRDGEVTALAAYLETHRMQLLAFIRHRIGAALKAKVEPEDIFQETSAEAVRTMSPEWPGDRDVFSWLCQVAERKIIDAHRHFGARKRDAARELSLDRPAQDASRFGLVNLLVNSMTTPSQAFSRNAREARLQSAVSELREEQREALRLRYVEGRPSKEIAARLGKSDAAIRVMLTRTMKQLHALLEEEDTN